MGEGRGVRGALSERAGHGTPLLAIGSPTGEGGVHRQAWRWASRATVSLRSAAWTPLSSSYLEPSNTGFCTVLVTKSPTDGVSLPKFFWPSQVGKPDHQPHGGVNFRFPVIPQSKKNVRRSRPRPPPKPPMSHLWKKRVSCPAIFRRGHT